MNAKLLRAWLAAIALTTAAGPPDVDAACPERVVRAGNVLEVAGREVYVPVTLTGLADENALAFSLSFDPTKLTYLGEVAGVGATGASLMPNTSQAGSGRLGYAFARPGGQLFGVGSNELVRVRFLLVGQPGTTTVAFADLPLLRETVNAAAAVLCSDYSNAVVTITPLIAPAVVTPPQSRTIQPIQGISTNVTFAVTASGSAPLAYQWRFNAGNLSGATGTAYTVTNLSAANAGSYDVVVSNDGGGVTSSPAVLTVLAALIPPVVMTQPRSLVVSTGETAVLLVEATGTAPLLYQWTKGGVNVANGTNSTLWMTNVTTAQGGTYAVKVSNNGGTVTSQNATLTVSTSVRTVQVVSPSVATGMEIDVPIDLVGLGDESSVGFSLNFDPARCTYGGITLGTGATGAGFLVNSNDLAAGHLGVALTKPAGQMFAAGTSRLAVFRFRAGDLSGNVPLTFGDQPVRRDVADWLGNSRLANFRDGTLNILASAPGIVAQPQSAVAPIFTNMLLQATVSGSVPLSFQWQRGGVDLPGATTATLTLNNVLPSQAGDYRLVVTNAVGAVTSSVATLTVPRVVRLGATNGATGNLVEMPVELLCAGDENSVGFTVNFDPGQMSLAGIVPGAGLGIASLNWNTNQAGRIGLAAALPDNGVFARGTQQLARVQLVLGQSAGSRLVTFGDTPVVRELADAAARPLLTDYQGTALAASVVPPVVTQPPAAQTVWAGTNAVFSVGVSGTKPMTYQWLRNGVAVAGATGATYTITNVQAAHAGNYGVQVTSSAGSVTSVSALLTVLVPRPDFFVSNVTGPAEAMAGQPVQIVWSLFNVGNGGSDPGWHHTLWLARDSSGSTPEFVAALPYPFVLGPGQSLSVTGAVIIPSTALGDRYFMVKADGSNTVTELNEANNSAVAVAKTHITSGDLVLKSVQAVPTATLGSTINVTWSVANAGTSPANVAWRDRIYLSTHANSVEGATRLLTVQAARTLDPGASYTNTQAVTLPTGKVIAAGTYFLAVMADVFNDLPETEETNNIAARAIGLTPAPLPDLTVPLVIAPGSAEPGQPFTVAWAVTNQGSAVATGPWREAVLVSNFVSGVKEVAFFDLTNTIAVSGEMWRTQTVTWPLTGPAGEARVLVAADYRGELDEQNETNNIGVAGAETLVPFRLALALPYTQVAEDTASPVFRGTLKRNGDSSVPLTVTIAISDATALSGPTNVVLAAGQDTLEFDLRVLHDPAVTGPKPVTITASAGGYANAAAALTVLNTDLPRLTLTLDAAAVLEGMSVSGTVTRDVVTDAAVTVMLQSSAPSQLSVPLTVTIPAGVPSWTFSVLAVDDDVVEPNATYTIYATSAGFQGGDASVVVVDNDLPTVTLTLADHIVSEGAGPQGTFATLRRSPVSSRALTIDLENSDPTAVHVPARVSIPAYAESTSFPVAAVDDLLVDGTQTAVLTPHILSATGVRVGTGTGDMLSVTDDDGPTLRVTIDKKLVAEGLNPAATVAVTRNTPGTNALVVALQSSDVNEATVPASVTIPLGTNAAYATLASVADGVHDGNKTVTISATAAGYTIGAGTVVVSDTDLPDLAVASITVPSSAETEGYFSVSYRVENQGLATAGTNFTTRVFLSSDATAGNDVLVGQFPFSGNIPSGSYVDQTLAVRAPLVSGQYWLIVQTDAGEEIPEIREDNNTGVSRTPVMVQAGYYATVGTSINAALAGTTIPMSGTAVLAGGGPAVSKPVNIHVVTRGTERIIAAITGSDGSFAVNWIPLPGEAGVYDIFATHPGVATAPSQDQFRLLGMRAEPAGVSLTVKEQSSVSGTVKLVNLSDQPLAGVTATLLAQPPDLGVTIDLSGATLPGSGSVNLNYTFTANTASAYGLVRVRLSTAEGLSVEVPFAVSVAPLRPHLVSTPGSLTAGMPRGRQTLVEFTVLNDGGIASGPLTVVTPNVPWISVVTTNPLPPLETGETNAMKVTLLLQPAADMALGSYAGSLALNSSNASLTVPFNFRALSEAKGDLLITAVDELTYYAEGAPKLAGASVTVSDAVSHQTVATGVTDANGQFYASALPEAYYDVALTADKHTAYRNTHLISAGQTNEISAFLSRQVVTYTWTVQPVAIEDNYRITVETTFETVVPLPVVTIEPAVIDLGKITAEVTQIELKISNQGLIAANNTRLSFPTHPLWKFEPLVDNVGVLPAKSSLTVPLIIRKVAPVQGIQPKDGGGACHLAAGVCWDLKCGERDNTYCGTIAMPNAQSGCGGTTPTASVSGPGNTTWTGGTSTTPSGGGYTTPGAGTVYVNTPSFAAPSVCDCDSFPKICISGSGGFSVDGFASKLAGAVTKFLPNFSVKEVEVKVHADGNLCSCCVSNQVSWEGGANAGADIKIVLRAGPGFSGSLGFDGGSSWSGVKAELDAMVGVEVTVSGSVSGSLMRKCLEEPDACLSGSIGFNLFAGAQLNAGVKATFTDGIEYSGSVSGQLGLQGSASATLTGCLKSGLTMQVCGEIWARANASGSVSATVAGQTRTETISVNCDTLLAGSPCSSNAKGDGPIVETLTRDDLLTPERNIAEALGVATVPPSGICAHVKLKTEQDAVISRDAFRATLEIGNADTVRLEQLQADVIVRDESGAEVASLFGIRPPELVGISGVDGTGILPAQSTGTAKWTIIPTSDAAPTAAKQYFVSGRLRYSQGGALVTVPLAPVAVTVLPNPRLVVHYFHERDVFSDDPFTTAVEPAIPFNLAVMIQNQGYGSAKNLRITSAQPQIVDNEKGLLIDFRIIATEVAGKNMVPSLTADFGNIDPGETRVGRWLMTSTLQGLFIDYKASFEHIDALNNPKLSLIDSVAIHEMNRLVWAGGTFEDGKPDFLVNEVQDLNDRPDTLWLSDGRTFPVSVVEAGTVDTTPAPSRLQVHLTASMPAGWTYLRIPEPSNGSYRLVKVERADGSALSMGTNAWTTDRTFVGRERPPVWENILHLLDYNSTGAYTLTYATVAAPDTTPPASSMAALPAQSSGQVALSWGGQDNDGGTGIAYYDIYVSVNGGLFTPWLLKTTSTGAVYPGAQNSSCAFYSIATDLAGNREPAPATPDAQTVVNIVNRAPELAPMAVQAINEGGEFVFTVPATDPDLPNDRLTFSLSGAPAGMRIDAASGVIRWTTAEATGPSTNTVTVVVRDNGTPQLATNVPLTVIVREVNQAPTLGAVANHIISEGRLLQITNTASDLDLPKNTLTYSFGQGAPSGATIDSTSGVFRWRPTETQGPSTNLITVTVTDNGVPPLSASRQFTVVVRDMMSDFSLSFGSTNLLAGEDNSVPLVLKSSLDLTSLDFTFQAATAWLTNSSLRLESPEILSAGVETLGPEHFRVNLTLDPALNLASERRLASLDFTARNTGHSAVVPLVLSEPVALGADGRVITNATLRPGRVIIVGQEPVLTLENPAQRRLTIYGNVGAMYMLQTSTNMAPPVTWRSYLGLTITNRIQVLDWTDVLGPAGFLRAREHQ